MMTRSLWTGLRPGRGFISMKLGSSWRSQRTSMRETSRQPKARFGLGAGALGEQVERALVGQTVEFSEQMAFWP